MRGSLGKGYCYSKGQPAQLKHQESVQSQGSCMRWSRCKTMLHRTLPAKRHATIIWTSVDYQLEVNWTRPDRCNILSTHSNEYSLEKK